MSDTKRRYVEAIDRFDTIHSRGWQHYRTILSRKLLSGRSTGTP
jgi:hypothetical protein